MLLVVDNGSVYTESILGCLKGLGRDHKRVTFDKITERDLGEADSVILSGRRKNDAAMNATNSRLIRYALSSNKPLLGICYGAEILAITLGGTIRKMARPRQGLYDISMVRENPLCKRRMEVFESHSYKVATLDTQFESLAVSNECRYEIFQYSGRDVFGTQFHPEMSMDGNLLLGNFSSIR